MATGQGLAEAYRKAGPYMGLGIEIAATVILCFVGGRWLDGKLETTPILALAGLMVGIGAATFHLLRAVNRLADRVREAEDHEVDNPADER